MLSHRIATTSQSGYDEPTEALLLAFQSTILKAWEQPRKPIQTWRLLMPNERKLVNFSGDYDASDVDAVQRKLEQQH